LFNTAANDNWRIKDNDTKNVDASPLVVSGGTLPTNLDFDNVLDITTTNATVTDLVSYTLADESSYSWDVELTGMKSDGTDRALYHDKALVYRDGGSATQQGATANIITAIESDANWAHTLDVTSNNARSRVTGFAATTINWRGRVKILSTA